MVEPTKLKPRRFRSLLMASDSGVRAGTLRTFHGFTFGLPSDKLPYVAIEGAELLLHAQEGFGVLDGRCDLQLVAHDARIGKERIRLSRPIVSGNALGIKVMEGSTVIVALVEDCAPTQSGLRAFQNKEFKECSIVMDGNTPLLVVVADVVLAFRPRATDWRIIGDR